MNRTYSGRFYDDFPATAGFLLTIVGFFVLEVVLQGKLSEDVGATLLDHLNTDTQTTYVLGSPIAALVLQDMQVWRLIAGCFLHYGPLHLAMNAWVLIDLGRTSEPLLGVHRFISTYVLCGIGASITSVAYYHLTGTLAAPAGASGALAGLIGLLLGHAIRYHDRRLRDSLLRWIAYIALFSLVIGNVDHAGHIGGLLGGFAFGWFVPRYTSSGSAKRWRIPAWIAVGACVVALGISVWSMFEFLART